MYKNIGQGELRRLLVEMGHALHFPVRLYLVGGTTMVYEGFRNQSKDADFGFEVDSAHLSEFERVVQQLKHKHNISIELVTPKDFIPLPSGWQDRCRFIGRYHQTDAFHYDPVSVALSKIERGKQQDFEDIRLLIQSGYRSINCNRRTKRYYLVCSVKV